MPCPSQSGNTLSCPGGVIRRLGRDARPVIQLERSFRMTSIESYFVSSKCNFSEFFREMIGIPMFCYWSTLWEIPRLEKEDFEFNTLTHMIGNLLNLVIYFYIIIISTYYKLLLYSGNVWIWMLVLFIAFSIFIQKPADRNGFYSQVNENKALSSQVNLFSLLLFVKFLF